MNMEHLADIEAIKQLKARYFRLMDTKNWAEFGDVFTREAVLGGGDQQIAGRPAIVEFISTVSDGVRSAHQGFLPEIEIVGAGQASGIWAMSDYFEVRGTEPPVGFQGYGHYADRYALEEGAWRRTRPSAAAGRQHARAGSPPRRRHPAPPPCRVPSSPAGPPWPTAPGARRNPDLVRRPGRAAIEQPRPRPPRR